MSCAATAGHCYGRVIVCRSNLRRSSRHAVVMLTPLGGPGWLFAL